MMRAVRAHPNNILNEKVLKCSPLTDSRDARTIRLGLSAAAKFFFAIANMPRLYCPCFCLDAAHDTRGGWASGPRFQYSRVEGVPRVNGRRSSRHLTVYPGVRLPGRNRLQPVRAGC